MARRSERASAAAAAAASTAAEVDHMDQSDRGDEEEEVVVKETQTDRLPRLRFDQALTWRPPRVIPVADLLKRLQSLSKELGTMEQGENDRDSFAKVAKELAFSGLLNHKDRGVKAWVACCLVDMLRLCAPDAPFTGAQLKDVFTLFITVILPALSDPSNAYNNQHLYVLQSLAEVKSIVLLTDIPSSDQLTLHLFTSFFDMMSASSRSLTGDQIGKNVEVNMTAILVILVDEATTMPVEVVDIIVAQFLRVDPNLPHIGRKGPLPVRDPKQSTLLLKEFPPAYNMARAICNSCPERMARNVSQYFNEVIMDASSVSAARRSPNPHHAGRRTSKGDEDSDDEHAGSGPTEDDLRELHKAHRLIRELWRASPAVLQSVIPQLEAELATENVQLRLLATETLGDIISGIGAAGPPPDPTMDPAAWPPLTLSDSFPKPSITVNVLTTPSSPQPFPQTHPTAYASFLNRRNDRSAVIRSAWTTGVARILSTAAGGCGLSSTAEASLLQEFAIKLGDADERVRLAAVKAISCFTFNDIITKLGSIGSIDTEGSLLSNLAARARDRKHAVRVESMRTLARLWGVASGELELGNPQVTTALGSIPAKLFDTFYVNDLSINVLLDHVLFELLLPLAYPPIKPPKSTSTGSSQTTSTATSIFDPDTLRTQRILLLLRSLTPKPRNAFFALLSRQVQLSDIMRAFLTLCESSDASTSETASPAARLIAYFSRLLPDPLRVSADLSKFARSHDRRSFQLLRFAMSADSDHRTIVKAIRELSKRIESSPTCPPALLDTLLPLVYRVAGLIVNKSHVPTILRLAGEDPAANELLLHISTTNPAVFKAHVRELCEGLTDGAPTRDGDQTEDHAKGIDLLKACAGFGKRFPGEIPVDRKFRGALEGWARWGAPRGAKFAVRILLAGERKELGAKELLGKLLEEHTKEKGKMHGKEGRHLLARLAALAELWRSASEIVDQEGDAVVDLAIKDVLLQPSSVEEGAKTTEDTEDSWLGDEELPMEVEAKLLALTLLSNRLLSHQDEATRTSTAKPVMQLLNTLVANSGALSKTAVMPGSHRARLRLHASLRLLKLCTVKAYDTMLSPNAFHQLAYLAQDALYEVRHGFVQKLKKYLGQNRLSQRFYAPVFLLAYEPRLEFKDETVTWLRARAMRFVEEKQTVMESVYARLLSLLAHHPDFGSEEEDLLDFARYLLFYLGPVAKSESIGLIFYVGGRVKQAVDGIDAAKSEGLYQLSELGGELMQQYASEKGWIIETWPGKVRLPVGLFRAMASSEQSQQVAGTRYLPEGLGGRIEALVKKEIRGGRKRKVDGGETSSKKRTKSSEVKTVPIRKPSKKGRRRNESDDDDNEDNELEDSRTGLAKNILMSSVERRRSGRETATKTYAEDSGSEVDDEPEDVDMDEDGEVGDEANDEGSEQAAKSKSDSDRGSPDTPRIAATTTKSPPKPRSESQSESKANAKAKTTPNGNTKSKSKPKPKPKRYPPASLPLPLRTTRASRSSVRTRNTAPTIDDDDDDNDDDDDLSSPPNDSDNPADNDSDRSPDNDSD